MNDVPPSQPDLAFTLSARGSSLMLQVLTGLVMPGLDHAHDGLQQSLQEGQWGIARGSLLKGLYQ